MDPVLIVDDEKDNLEALQRLLRTQFDITATTSAFEALKWIQKKEFHVIVSDQRMPEMSGVELFEKIKNVAPESTRILLTGFTDMDAVIGAINRGHIYRYVAKPWDPEELKLTLRQANEAYGLRREIEQKNAELKKALEELSLLDRAKARFLSLISHELNTPLTVLQSFVHLIEERKSDLSGEMKAALSGLTNASNRFSGIVEDVLAFVKLEADSGLHLQPYNFKSAILAIKESLKDLEKKNLTFNLKCSNPPTPQCDPEKMTIALRKLLEDTVLHAPPKSSIEVIISEKPNPFFIHISRKGEPLTEEALNAFVVSGNEFHHHKGLGLGLAICRHIIARHGGKMGVEKRPGSMTLVSITL